jgi:preprotein translocase subunit SecA
MFDDEDFDMNFHFLGDDNISPEQKAELQRELRERIENARNHPLARKAKEINTIVDALLESLEPDEDDDEDEDDDAPSLSEYLRQKFEDNADEDEMELTDEEERDMLMNTLFHHTKHQMRMNAMTIGAKFASTAAQDNYMLAMENAVLMKIAARDLLAQSAMLQYEGTADAEHLQVLRRAVEEFRLLFVDWVATLKRNENEEPDGWGLFL